MKLHPFVVALAGLAIFSGCVSPAGDPARVAEVRRLQAEQSRHFDDPDVHARMAERAKTRFADIARLNHDAVAGGHAVTSPRLIRNVQPHYPFLQRWHLGHGGVWVAFIVTTDGNPDQITPLFDDDEIPDASFVRAVIDAVKQWKFSPGTIDGQPAPCIAMLPVLFQMQL